MRDVNSLNKVILIGHVGQNPEMRYIPQTETAVANFSLATNEKIFNPSTSESDTRTEWHRIVAWRKLAEFCERYLSKGKQIMVEGRIRTEKWQDRDGNTKFRPLISLYSEKEREKKRKELIRNLFHRSFLLKKVPFQKFLSKRTTRTCLFSLNLGSVF
jgi:single-strand DNA-binding protein